MKAEKGVLKRDEVNYSELTSGQKGIGLGEEDWFLLVKKNGKWSFSLWNLMPYEALTSWVSLDKMEDLRSSPKAKVIRDKLKERWSNASDVAEAIIIEARYHISDFVSGEVEEELERIEEGEKKQSQADKLVILASSQCIEFFHDQTKTAYVQIIQGGVRCTMPIRSRQFKAWLANLLWLSEGKAPGTEGVYGAINVLEAKALFEGKKYTLYNRVAPANDGIWIDMADEQWRAILVTGEGWSIVDNPPILFKRYSHQLPLVEPAPGGDPWRLLDFFNIDPTDMDTRLTLLCTAITFLIPLIPHPIPILYGIQGSGKTWVFKLLRQLLDPSCIDVLALPRDERERVQQLDHHWLAFYDNVTNIPWWMSDTLCRAATGGGFTKRELYTNDDDVIYNFKRCVGLNGINIVAQRGDLLDRSLLVGLQNIPKEKRRTEEELLRDFEACKAEIFGGFLDTLVKAIQIYPSVNPKGLFRMADFTRWGCAIAIALGKTEKDFIDAYEAKVKAQIEEAAHASPVATVLLDFMENRGENWAGTPTELFTALLNHAKTLDISTRQRGWPKAPHVLVRQLNELAPSLKSLGWEVNTSRSGARKRIEINSVPSVTSVTDMGDKGDGSDASDASDAIFPTSFSLGEKLTLVYDKCRELAIDGLVSKFDVADALDDKIPRDEVFRLLDILEKEGKLVAKGPEWYVVVI